MRVKTATSPCFGVSSRRTTGAWQISWLLILVLGFFGLCVAFVYGCDKIIGPDDDADLDDEADDGRRHTELEVTA